MIADLDTQGPIPAETDVVIVGSGPVGIVLAVSLARAGKKVTILECGGPTVEQRSQDLNTATVSGRRHLGVWEGRARIFGGTSTLWGGQLIPFREIDFKARPWLGLEAWPIQRSDLAAFFEKTKVLLGLPLTSDKDDVVWTQLGMDRPDFGQDLDLVVTQWLKEANLARLFVRDLTSHPNITVLLHACAVGFENDGGQITGVAVKSPGGRDAVVRGKQVVLACGTIEASRLMLATAQRNPALPWAGNPWVGLGFQDHLDCYAATVEPIDKKAFNDIFDNIFIKGYKYNPKLALASHVQEAQGITNIAAVMAFSSSMGEHLGNIKIFLRSLRSGVVPPNLRSMPQHLMALGKIWWPLVSRYIRDNRMFNPADRGIQLHIHCEQRPLDSSRVCLDDTRKDMFGLPQTKLEWQVDGMEIDTIAVFCEKVAQVLEDKGLAKVTIDPRVVARDPAMLDEAKDTNHHCGGLRMAESADKGVVDRDLKVFGTQNMHIAGAAVFPSASFANPTFTAMALAMRLSEHLA